MRQSAVSQAQQAEPTLVVRQQQGWGMQLDVGWRLRRVSGQHPLEER